MKRWILREVKSFALNLPVSKWQSPDTDVIMSDFKVVTLPPAFREPCLPNRQAPAGQGCYPAQPSNKIPSMKMFSTMDPLADPVPFSTSL